MNHPAQPWPASSPVPPLAMPSPYLAIKLAQGLFGAAPEALSAEQRDRVSAAAARQLQIEQAVLASPEAHRIAVPPAAIDAALAEVAGRFATEADFVCTLAAQGLSLAQLREHIARDLAVDAVLEAVSARAAAVSATDIELFYWLHIARFMQPERRTVRHILITINEGLAGSERFAARRRIDEVRATCTADPARFGELALRHSECPTAMQGGLIGAVPRGQLFPTLDAALFALQPGALSGVLESPMGFHFLLCEGIHPAARIPLAKVRDKIAEQLGAARRAAHQRRWLAQLLRG